MGGYMMNSKWRRGERMIALLVHLLQNPERRFSIGELMSTLELPPGDRRNVQRDMQALVSLPGPLVVNEGEASRIFYRCALSHAGQLMLPDMENSLLSFAFLRRIAGIYPATAELIEDLIGCLQDALPGRERRLLSSLSAEISNRIVFMGSRAELQEDASKFLALFLRAIQERRKVETTYWSNEDDGGLKQNKRIPLLVVIYQSEVYIGCVSESHPGETYYLKLRRVRKARLLGERYTDDPALVQKFRERIYRSGGMLGEQNPLAEHVRLRCPPYFRPFLEERPYHPSQKIRTGKDGILYVSLNVEINFNFLQWVCGHQERMEVLAPQKVRDRLAEYGRFLAKQYGEKIE